LALEAATKAIVAHALAGRGWLMSGVGPFHPELYRTSPGPGNIRRGHRCSSRC